jgi:hypothetical protein
MRATKLVTLLGALMCATAVSAQTPPTPPPGAPPRHVPDPKLAFDRETFTYPGDSRMDPFRPLVGLEGVGGPMFEDLVLRGIFFVPTDASQSLATITDGSKKLYRVRVGDVIGNARISQISKTNVHLLVQSYGVVRQEVMNMAPRPTAEDFRNRQNAATGDDLSRLFQQELLKALTGTGNRPATQPATQPTRPDTTRRTGVPPRRDTISSAPIRPRNQER